MSGIIHSVKSMYSDLVTGTCKTNFNKMSTGKKYMTVLKVAGIAAAAGILAALVGAAGGSFLGFLFGVAVTGTVGTAAFAYFTSQQSLGEQISTCAKKCVQVVKEAL
jgi:hypothetical protein